MMGRRVIEQFGFVLDDGRECYAAVLAVPHREPMGRRIVVRCGAETAFDSKDHANGANAFAALREWAADQDRTHQTPERMAVV